jgi:hypothetical protein
LLKSGIAAPFYNILLLVYSDVTAPSLLFFLRLKKSFGKCLFAFVPIAFGTRNTFLLQKILS